MLCVSLVSCDRGADTRPIRASELVGTWAIKDHKPTGSAQSNCATDYSYTLGEKGDFAGEFDEGGWTLEGNRLTITVTQSNYDTGGEGPLKPVSENPIVYQILNRTRSVVALTSNGTQLWSYACN